MPLKDDLRFKDPLFIDALTGIYNRYFLYQVVPEVIQKAEDSHTHIGILMLDIDNFKDINDTYGHLTGDRVLKEVAKILGDCIRGEDFAIRYAGDEFIVVFCSSASETSSFETGGRRIVEKVSKTAIEVEKTSISLTVSGGLAIYPYDGKNLDVLIESADKALYLSKEKGKNQLSLSEEVTEQIITQQEALRLFPCKKFIDRLSQIEHLKRTLKESLTSKVSFVVIRGRKGMGKTRLLEEFKEIANAQQIFSLEIPASSKYASLSYHAFCQALEIFLKENETLLQAIVSSLDTSEIIDLATLVPVFKSFAPNVKDKTTKEKKGLSLFKALRRICIEFSSSQGLLLCFDDIQHLDRATFELLDYFFNYEFTRPIMVCATLDEEELKDSSFCKEFLSRPKDNVNFSLLELSPFSVKETEELIKAIFPQMNLPPEFSPYICEITGGNPLFIEELLKYLLESRVIVYRKNKWQLLRFDKKDIPSFLEDVLEQRLKKLDPETKEILAKLAVMGDDFEVKVLREAIKKDEGFLFELLDRARKKGFIQPKEKSSQFSFSSSYLQKILYDQIGQEEKANLHQDIASAIEKIYKDKPPKVLPDLAYHYEHSGDIRKFNEYRNKILKESQKLFDPHQLENYLEALSKEVPSTSIPFEIQIRKIDSQIHEEELVKIVDLTKYILAAVRSITLYPSGNKIRENSVEKVYTFLESLLKNLPSLTLAEVEKLFLVNNKRIPFEKEKDSVIREFIIFMIDRDIKAIQFLPLVNKEEIDLFLSILAENPESLRGGLVAQLMHEKNIKYIKIDAASYARISYQRIFRPVADRINKITLLNFLSGKTTSSPQILDSLLKAALQQPQNLALNLTEIAKASLLKEKKDISAEDIAEFVSKNIHKIANEFFTEGKPDAPSALHHLISSFDENVKSYLFSRQPPYIKEIVKELSDEEVMEMVLSAVRLPQQDRLLYMRQIFNKLDVPLERKEKIASQLKKRLEKLGFTSSEISFVTERKYETLSLTERVSTLLQLTPSAYSSVGIENIRDLLKELIEDLDKDNLNKLLRHFLSLLDSKDTEDKKVILELLSFLFSIFPVELSEFDEIIFEVISGLIDKFTRADLAVYPVFIEVLRLAMEWSYKGVFSSQPLERWVIRNRFTQVDTILNSLYKIMESEQDSQEAKEKKRVIKEFIFGILLNSSLIPAFARELKDPLIDYNKMITYHIVKFGRQGLRKLLREVLESKDFSWEGFFYRKKVASLLKNMKDVAREELKEYLTLEKDFQKLKQIREIISFMGERDLLEA